MVLQFTSDDLVEAVRREAFIPDASDVTDEMILAWADEEMLSTLDEILKSSQQSYFVSSETVTLGSSLRYRYPRRALGRTIVGVTWLDSQGFEHPLVEMDVIDGQFFGSSGNYYVEGDWLVFYRSTPANAVSIRWHFMQRPSKLVPVASCAPIAACPSSTTLTITGSLPATINPSKFYVDVVRGDAPYDLMYTDAKTDGVVSTTVTLTNVTLDPSLFVSLGAITNDRQDYLCPRDCTPYPPIPNEGWPLLVSRVARVVMEATKDKEGAIVADASAARRDAALRAIIQPRNEAGNRTLVNNRSAMRGGFGGWGTRGRRWFP